MPPAVAKYETAVKRKRQPSRSCTKPKQLPPLTPLRIVGDTTTANVLRGSSIPQNLRGLKAWCAWDLIEVKGKQRKVPIHPDGSNFASNRHTPYTFDEVIGIGSGVGLVLTGGLKVDGKYLIGFDCDACRDPLTGALMPWAEALRADHRNSYSEYTPSGEGIRVLVLADELPESELHKVRSLDPADNTSKRPEIETYGLGRACYITVSGDIIPGSSPDIETVRSLKHFMAKYPSAVGGVLGEIPELPVGQGEPLSLTEMSAQILAHPDGLALAEGKWEDVVPDGSASEGFYQLVQRAVRAAHGHGDLALRWLLECTEYGAGKVDSAEPDRYMRESWVAAEVARIAHKAPRTDPAVFKDEYAESLFMPSESEQADRQLSVKAADDASILQVDAFISQVAGREWLVDELFPSDGLASVFGKPGQGKTPFVLRLAIATAAGHPEFFGRRMEQHGPVVVFVGEDEAGVRDRVLAQLNEIDPLLVGSGLPLYFTREPGRITEPDNVDVWINRIHTVTKGVPPRLVVIDTLARNFGGGNESATEDMQSFVDGCDVLSRHLKRCLVVCTHHPSKGNEDAGRGSGVLLGALDTEIKVELTGRTKLVATPTKIKGGPIPEDPLVGTLVPVKHGLGFKSSGAPRTAITLDDTPPDPCTVFAESSGDEITIRILRAVGSLDGPTSRGALASSVGVTVKVLRGRETKLESAGLITIRKGAGGRSQMTYLLTGDGSRVITGAGNERALFEGTQPVPEGVGHDEGTEGTGGGNLL